MSKIAPRPRPIIVPRTTMSAARKRRIWEAHGGRCEECGRSLPVDGPLVQYDHILPLALEGADTDDNLQPLCTVPCHARKTAHDIGRIRDADRQRRKLVEDREPSRRPLNGRPFDTTRTRGFDGKVKLRLSRSTVSAFVDPSAVGESGR